VDCLSKEDLAAQAGVTEADVDRMVSAGILSPGGADAPFTPGDVRRIRLAQTCERAGLPLEGIGEAMKAGKLSFSLLDMPTFRWSPLTDRTYQELAEEAEIPVEVLLDMQQAMGFARPEPGDRARTDDLEILPIVKLILATGVLDAREMMRTFRVYGESIRRITDAETVIYHSRIELPMLASGVPERQMMQMAAEMGERFVPLQDRFLMTVYERHRERSWTEDLVGHIESALEEAGQYRRLPNPPAMAFVDLSGFTRLTEERGDEAAAELAGAMGELVQGESHRHGGRPVKWLGDGVMFHFPEPRGAVLAALDIVEAAPEAGLPPAHAGVAAGPVISQDGDYYGRTVNLAARISARAAAGQVLVEAEVTEAVRDGVDFRELGPMELKGMLKPVSLFEAVRVPRTS
jgi:class 3 adenylate cyclase/DNA-binding transcriptional MerR regulator